MSSLETVAVTPGPTAKGVTALAPLTSTEFSKKPSIWLAEVTMPVGPSIVIGPDVPVRSKVLRTTIDSSTDALKTVGSNSMTLPAGLALALAWPTQYRRSPMVAEPAPVSDTLSTV